MTWHWWCCKQQKKQGLPKWPIMEAQQARFFSPTGHTKQWQQWSPYNRTCRVLTSCYIAVFVCWGLAPFNVLFVYQDFDTLLNHADTWVKPSSWLANYLCGGKRRYVLYQTPCSLKDWSKAFRSKARAGFWTSLFSEDAHLFSMGRGWL